MARRCGLASPFPAHPRSCVWLNRGTGTAAAKPCPALPHRGTGLARPMPLSPRPPQLTSNPPWALLEQAYELFRTCGGSATFPLVLMDLSMPVCDGWTAASYIRALERAAGWPPCRIVACSSEDLSPGSPALARCWDVGMDVAVVSASCENPELGDCRRGHAGCWLADAGASVVQACLAAGRSVLSVAHPAAQPLPTDPATSMARQPAHPHCPAPPSPTPQGKAVSRDLATQLLQQSSCPPSAFGPAACCCGRSSEDSTSCSLSDLRRQPSAAPSEGTSASSSTAAPMDRSQSAPPLRSRQPLPPSPRGSMDGETGCLPDPVRLSLASSFFRSASS